MPTVAPAELVLRGDKVATVDPAPGNTEAIAVNGYQVNTRTLLCCLRIF
jgi:hypothetical protein